MRILMEYAVNAIIGELDAVNYALWDDWSREVVEVTSAFQTSDGFFAKDGLGRNIEILEEDQRRIGTPMLRNFMMELYETGCTDIRGYAVRVYEDEES